VVQRVIVIIKIIDIYGIAGLSYDCKTIETEIKTIIREEFL